MSREYYYIFVIGCWFFWYMYYVYDNFFYFLGIVELYNFWGLMFVGFENLFVFVNEINW